MRTGNKSPCKRRNSVAIGVVALLVVGTGLCLLWRTPSAIPTLAGPPQLQGTKVVFDAGHGGEDGGAVSPSGTVESGINLENAENRLTYQIDVRPKWILITKSGLLNWNTLSRFVVFLKTLLLIFTEIFSTHQIFLNASNGTRKMAFQLKCSKNTK